MRRADAITAAVPANRTSKVRTGDIVKVRMPDVKNRAGFTSSVALPSK